MSFGFFFQAEDGIRDGEKSRGLGDVYKGQVAVPRKFIFGRSQGVGPGLFFFFGARPGPGRPLALIHL